MNECKRPILIATGYTTPPDRVKCSHPVGHSGPHLGTLTDGRQYEWTTDEVPVRGRFVQS
jgi:hypothetical protein